MSALVRFAARPILSCARRQPSSVLKQKSNYATRPPSAFQEMETYWVKNKANNRPLSPHLSIYRPHLTMMVSISNRVTAVALQAGVTLGGIYVLLSPKKFPEIMSDLKQSSVGYAFLALVKFAAAFTFAYHLVAGGRHLLWDVGLIGKSKAETLKGSYATLALAAACLLVLLVMKPAAEKK